MVEDIVRIDRHLASTAWSIDDILWDRVTTGEASESFDDFNAFCHGGPEMRRAAYQVALVKIVRAHTAEKKLVNEVSHDLRVVVDAFEKHALIAEGNATVGKAPESVADLGGQLAGMVHMHTHPKRMILTKHLTEGRSNPLREENGNACAYAQKLKVRDTPQSFENRFQA